MRSSPFNLILLLAAFLTTAVPIRGQRRLADLTATPEDAATLYLRSVRAIQWGAAAQFLHPQTLARFRTLVVMMTEADSTGEVGRYLVGMGAAGLESLDAPTVFERSVGRMIDDMPGLMHAMFDRDDEVLGHVDDGSDSAHVVYRTTARLSGAVPEVKVMELERTNAGWRVLWSDELEVLDAALRGIPRAGAARPTPRH